MILCPNCSKGLTLGEYFFSRGVRDPQVSAAREFGFYTCPNCQAVSAKPRVVLHVWGQVLAAVLGYTVLPFGIWAGIAVGLLWFVISMPKLTLVPKAVLGELKK